MKVLKCLWAALGAAVVCVAQAGTDFSEYVTEGTLTIPAATTVTIDDDNAAAFADVTTVVFADKTAQITFANTTQIVAGQTFTGAGKIEVSEGGKLKLTGNSPSYTGNFNITSANVVVASRHALGKAYVTTYNGNNDPFQIEFDGEQETDASIYVVNAAQFQRDPSKTVTFNGTMRQGTSELANYALGNVVMTGTLRNENKQQKLKMLGSGQYHAYINNFRFGSNFQMEGDGWVHMTKKPEMFGLALTLMSQIKLVCGAKDCLNVPAYGILFRESSSSTSPRRIDLGGYDQSVKYVGQYLVSISEGGKTEELITSTNPAQFTVNDLINQSRSTITEFTYPFRFNGAAGLTCNIPAASRMNLINIVSDTTGKLEVKRGTLEFKWKAGWGGTNVVVSGGTLICNSANSITNDQARLVISSGTLENNVDLHVGSANIGGEELAAGPYTSADYPDYLTGGSTLYVNYYPKEIVYKDYHWIGGGSDDKLTTKENWLENEVPDFTAAGATLKFDSDLQTHATAEGELYVNRIEICGTRPFTLDAADENAIIHLGTETENDRTIVATNPSPSVANIPTNVINVAVHTTSPYSETWNVGAYTALDLRGKISGAGSAAVVLMPICLPNVSSSYGTMILSGDNSGLVRPFNLKGGKFFVRHENALGAATRAAAATGGDGVRIKFGCLTNNVPFTVDSGSAFNNFEPFTDRSEGLVFNGKFTGTVGMSLNLSGLTFRGGLQCGNFQAHQNGRIENTGVKFTGVQAIRQDAGTITLASHGNSWTCWNLVDDEARLKCGDTNVLVNAKCIHFGEWNSVNWGILDLNGYDQICGGFARYMYNGTPVYTKGTTDFGFVTSAVPARVTWNGAPEETIGNYTGAIYALTNQVRFTGATSLKVSALASVTHTVVNAKSETKGTLEIASGNLVFAWGAGWTATTNVVVSGGTLIVEEDSAPYAFGPAEGRSMARMAITGTGTLKIVGGQATVRALSTDGETFLAPGVYGSADSGVEPAWQLDCLAGAGTLKVRTDGQCHGMMLYVK